MALMVPFIICLATFFRGCTVILETPNMTLNLQRNTSGWRL